MDSKSVASQFKIVSNYLNTQCLERVQEIDLMLACAISGQHMFLLGPPGTAKSHMIRKFHDCFTGDAKYFEATFAPHVDADQIFGAIDLAEFKKSGKQILNTQGYMPESHFAFLDEIWKANDSLLQSLLSILNERTFKNGPDLIKAPLRFCLSASNEVPANSSLGALYDRFAVRRMVKPLQQSGSVHELIMGLSADPAPKVMTLELLDKAKALSSQVSVEGIIEPIKELVFSTRSVAGKQDGFYISDRKIRQMIEFLKAIAVLRGQNALEPLHMRYLVDLMWDNPEQRDHSLALLSKYTTVSIQMTTNIYNELIPLINKAMATTDHKECTDLYKLISIKSDEMEIKLKGITSEEESEVIKSVLQQAENSMKPLRRRIRSLAKG